MKQTSFLEPQQTERIQWEPNRASAQSRLGAFVPRAGSAYAKSRNIDYGAERRTNVSALSPWVRHRLILEEEVLHATLSRHSMSSSEKFVQEVFWRGYFKGWLEHRPEVWRRYRQAVSELVGQLESDASLARRYEEAVSGKTGIACFDAWVEELLSTGYLHNHARMWFASIWIFTLKLPWELGADFFYRNLLDGDPASNTCSWRWVGGLHTAGKTYLARASNIERCTDGRFNPAGQLAADAPPLTEPVLPDPALPSIEAPDLLGLRYALVITEEDCSVESLDLVDSPAAVIALAGPTPRSVLPVSEGVNKFAVGAVRDAATRASTHFPVDIQSVDDEDWQGVLLDLIEGQGFDAIATARLPIGPVRRRLLKAAQTLSIPLIEYTRPYDRATWPNAKRGFFGLKKKISSILSAIELA
ncbi:MAG: FAD-binding domain-containing protein [Pseudomonadota bacterium]